MEKIGRENSKSEISLQPFSLNLAALLYFPKNSPSRLFTVALSVSQNMSPILHPKNYSQTELLTLLYFWKPQTVAEIFQEQFLVKVK